MVAVVFDCNVLYDKRGERRRCQCRTVPVAQHGSFDINTSAASLDVLLRQYRIPSHYIMYFPSNLCYDGRLIAPPTAGLNPTIDNGGLRQFAIITLEDTKEERITQGPNAGSYKNEAEASYMVQFAVSAIFQLGFNPRKDPDPTKKRPGVTILTYYRGQLDCFAKLIEKNKWFNYAKWIRFATIDACQGREDDVILISTVRRPTEAGQNPGFLQSEQRFDAGILRTKSALFVFLSTYKVGDVTPWRPLLDEAYKKENELMQAQMKFFEDTFKDLETRLNEINHMSAFAAVSVPPRTHNECIQWAIFLRDLGEAIVRRYDQTRPLSAIRVSINQELDRLKEISQPTATPEHILADLETKLISELNNLRPSTSTYLNSYFPLPRSHEELRLEVIRLQRLIIAEVGRHEDGGHLAEAQKLETEISALQHEMALRHRHKDCQLVFSDSASTASAEIRKGIVSANYLRKRRIAERE